jgi:rRNA maturation protein Nop10
MIDRMQYPIIRLRLYCRKSGEKICFEHPDRQSILAAFNAYRRTMLAAFNADRRTMQFTDGRSSIVVTRQCWSPVKMATRQWLPPVKMATRQWWPPFKVAV